MRIACLLPGVTETLYALGLGHQLVGRAAEGVWPKAVTDLPVVARYRLPGEAVPATPIMPNVLEHRHVSRLLIDQAALQSVAPDLVFIEETCPVCIAAYAPVAGTSLPVAGTTQTWGGKNVRLVSLAPQHLQDCADLIQPLAAVLGVPERGVPLHKQRDARLLALRMHIARYLVRAGGAQPRVTAVLAHRGEDGIPPWVTEMLDAAGGVGLRVVEWTEGSQIPDDVAHESPQVVLFGRAGQSVQTVRESLAGRVQGPAWPADRTWAVDADDVFSFPGPHLIEGVECLIRIIIPEALGANGTPPPATQAIRV